MAVQLYVGTERGMITLREGKRGWKRTHATLAGRPVVALDYDRGSPSLVYIAVDNEGIYSSSDAGGSSVFRVGGDAHCLYVRRNASRIIYAGMNRALLWASGDGGEHWERLDSFRELWGDPEEVVQRERPRGIVRAVIGLPENRYGILAGLDPEGLAFSLDDGHIWNFVEGSPAGIRSLIVSPANPAYLYVATETGVARSINGGNDWLPSNDGLPEGPTAWVSATMDHLFTSIDGQLYRAGQGVPVWQAIATPTAGPMTAVAMDEMDRRQAGGFFYGTADGIIARSRDGGATWREEIHGLPPVLCIAVTRD